MHRPHAHGILTASWREGQTHRCSQCLVCKKLLEVNTYGQLLRGAGGRADHPGGVPEGVSNTLDPDTCPNGSRVGTWDLHMGSERSERWL